MDPKLGIGLTGEVSKGRKEEGGWADRKARKTRKRTDSIPSF